MTTQQFHGTLQIEQFPGKGGWHYALVPIDVAAPHSPFGWLEVQCKIDEIDLGTIKLMPMGNGRLFLPLKKSLRTSLKKQRGDQIEVWLQYFQAQSLSEKEIEESLHLSGSEIQSRFQKLAKTEQSRLKKWILSSKLESVQIDKINRLIACLDANEKTSLLK